MSRRGKILVAIAVVAGLGGLIVWHFTSPRDLFETTYQGRMLEDWVREFERPEDSGEQAQALATIRVICSNNFPALVAALDYDPNPYAERVAPRLSWLPSWLRIRLMDGPLRDRREDHAATALMVFGALGSEGATAIPELEKLASHTNVVVAERAMSAMLPIRGTNGMTYLLSAMEDENVSRRLGALVAFEFNASPLGTNADRAALPVLLRCLQSADPRVVTTAAEALVDMKAEPAIAVPALVAALSNPDAGVRRATVYALREFGDSARAAAPELVRRLQDPSAGVREAAADALQSIAPETRTNGPASAPPH